MLTAYFTTDRRAVALKPLHPESRGLLAETYGLANDLRAMRASISESVRLFDEMDATSVSLQSLASVHHKLATVYLSVRALQLHLH